MSSIKLSPNASGTGIFSIEAPNSNTNRTLTLPDATGTFNISGAVNEVPAGSASAPSVYPTGDSNTGIFFPVADTVAIATGGSERARITSGGDLLVGTTSVAGSAVATFVKTATAANQRVLHLINTGASGSNSPAGLNIQYTNASSGNGSTYIECYDSNSTRFLVLGSGNVQNANNSYGAISDIKHKENIADATPKLEKLNQVRVVNFNLIGDTQKQIGVIAQELEQIFPGMVEQTPDRDEEGNDLGTTTKSVKYSVFVPMLIKAVQELNAKVEAQAAEIAALKGVQ